MVITKILGSTAVKTVLLHGVIVPVIATVVSYEVQKAIMKREQQKAMLIEQAKASNQECVEVPADML